MEGQGHCKRPLEIIAFSGHKRGGHRFGGSRVLILFRKSLGPQRLRREDFEAIRMLSPRLRGWCQVWSAEGGVEVAFSMGEEALNL